MRRARWQGNDGAVAVALVGVLVLATAATLYGSSVWDFDVDSCASLPAGAADPSTITAYCLPHRVARADSVRSIAILGAILLAVAVVTARYRWLHADEDRDASWGLPAWSSVPALWTAVALIAAYESSSYVRVGPLAVASGVFGAWWCASLLRAAEVRAHLLVAAAVAVPVACAGTAVAEAVRWRTPSRPWRVQEAGFPHPVDWWPVLIAAVVTAAVFAVAVAIAKAGRRPLNVWVGAALFSVSTVVTVPVFVPDLVPAWRTGDRGLEGLPGPLVWLPILLTPAVLAAVVWAWSASRRVTAPAPTPVDA